MKTTMHYLLIYETSPDYLFRRSEFRSAHLALAWESVERGELVLGGATGEPTDGTMMLFKADTPEIPSAFAKTDPYVLNGLIVKWTVKLWSTVVGHEASNPIHDA